MLIQYTYNDVRIQRTARHSASNIALMNNPFALLREQANSSASLLGLIKMAAAGMYEQLNIDNGLQSIFTAKKKTCNINRCILVNMSQNKHCLPFPLSKSNFSPITGHTNHYHQ
jgi:hypothetical protein